MANPLVRKEGRKEGRKEESGNALNVPSMLRSIVIVLNREEAYISAPAASAAS